MNTYLFRDTFERIAGEIGRVVLGQEDAIAQVLLAYLASGHVLLEGVPGLGKTLLARTLSFVVGGAHKRVQFTPDLMPTDITGGNVFDAARSQFVFHPGPLFTELLLADEINRAPAKTQSALLEAMQEASVTVDGVSHRLPASFFVMATQNPVESQGTYPLPEAQLDRFLMKLVVRHPTVAAESAVVRQFLGGFDVQSLGTAHLSPQANPTIIAELKQCLLGVQVDESIVGYVVEIVTRTRAHPSVYLGASPRASLGLAAVARAQAAREGRDFVIPDDVKAFAAPVLRHRMVLHPDAELEGVTPDDCIDSLLREVPVPRGK